MMKKKARRLSRNFIVLLMAMQMLILFHSAPGNAQTVFPVDFVSQAHIKVFEVDFSTQADLLVYLLDFQDQAENCSGLWFYTDFVNQAQWRIFFTEFPNQADLKIYYVKFRTQAGWQNKEKKKLFFFRASRLNRYRTYSLLISHYEIFSGIVTA